MRSLELKVPPPIVALLVAGAMWGVSLISRSSLQLSTRMRGLFAIPFVLIAVGVSVAGVAAFRRAKMTLNPMRPQDAGSLVTAGIYRFTRNPMYLGLCILLIGWAVFLFSPLALAGPVLFVLYINRFQIVPEELALTKLFGDEFTAYQKRVHRWF